MHAASPDSLSGHQPVLLAEVLEGLAPEPGGAYLDGTVGGGGHAAALLESAGPGATLLGLDRDPNALKRAALRLAPFGGQVTLVHGSFGELAQLASTHGFGAFDGILLDLGFSSDQVDDPERGLAFRLHGPLDMRLDPGAALTADDLVNGLAEAELADLIYAYGEEHRSRRIARAIVAARPLHTTTALAETVARAAGGRPGKIHPATKTFQALRIAVNDELAALDAALPQAIARLKPGGRLAVISFHSLEDRRVKRALAEAASDCICPPGWPKCTCGHTATLRLLPRKAIQPGPAELAANPRARSAKLRVAERLADDIEADRTDATRTAA